MASVFQVIAVAWSLSLNDVQYTRTVFCSFEPNKVWQTGRDGGNDTVPAWKSLTTLVASCSCNFPARNPRHDMRHIGNQKPASLMSPQSKRLAWPGEQCSAMARNCGIFCRLWSSCELKRSAVYTRTRPILCAKFSARACTASTQASVMAYQNVEAGMVS